MVAATTMPERRSERKSRDPVGRLRRWFSGTGEESAVVRTNGSTEESFPFALEIHVVRVDANLKLLMFREEEASKEIVSKQWYMEHSTELYRLRSRSTYYRVEN